MFSSLRIAASYHQLYLFDDDRCPAYPEDIDDVDLASRLKAVPNLLAIYTSSDGEVELRVEVIPSGSSIDQSQWVHIVVGSLSLPSGRLVVASPQSHLPACVRLPVPAGSYQVRVASRGFGRGSTEEYLVSLSPGPSVPVSVIKSAGPYAA